MENFVFLDNCMDEGPLRWGPYLEVESMDQKTKPHIESLVLG